MFKLTIAPEEIETLEPACFQGQIHVISPPGLEFSRAIAYLRKQTLLGFDTESKPVFTPGQPHNGVALLQLSGPDQAFLFRIQKLGMRKRICAKMAANILGVRISKSQQLSNWEAETLNAHQQLYAATDAWVCREMYLKLQECEKHPLKPEEMCPPEQLPLALREKLEKK